MTRGRSRRPEVNELSNLDDTDGELPFYACLRHPGCGWWHSVYRSDGLTVRLQLHGVREATGFLTMEYESPEFAPALGRYELQSRKLEESAL